MWLAPAQAAGSYPPVFHGIAVSSDHVCVGDSVTVRAMTFAPHDRVTFVSAVSGKDVTKVVTHADASGQMVLRVEMTTAGVNRLHADGMRKSGRPLALSTQVLVRDCGAVQPTPPADVNTTPVVSDGGGSGLSLTSLLMMVALGALVVGGLVLGLTLVRSGRGGSHVTQV
jgi:hypothetical protein